MPNMAHETDDRPADDDARFAQLIKDEYGVAVSGPAASEDAAHSKLAHPSRRVRRRSPVAPSEAPPEWFSLDRAIDQAEPDTEPFIAPKPAPLPRPRNPLALLGVALLLVAVGLGLAWVAGAPVPLGLRWAAGLAIGGGLACLLFSLPKHREPDLDDGAVL